MPANNFLLVWRGIKETATKNLETIIPEKILCFLTHLLAPQDYLSFYVEIPYTSNTP